MEYNMTKDEGQVPTDGELAERWSSYFSGDGKHDLKALIDEYPKRRSVVVRFPDLDHHDTDFCVGVFKWPRRALTAGRRVIRAAIPADLDADEVGLQIIAMPRDRRVEVRDLRSDHMGRLISVDGMVKRAAEVRPRLVEGVFECLRCGRHNVVIQDDTTLREPMECQKDGTDAFGNSGCGRASSSTSFKLVPEFCKFINSQKLEIQEAPEDMKAGAQPQSLTCLLDDDLAGNVYPGDSVTVNGVMLTKQQGSGKSTTFGVYMSANSVENKEPTFDELETTVEDELAIQKLAASPMVYDDLAKSVCPTIYGYEIEKQALALQLFGGVQKTMPDGTNIRGDIHILLVGDPGTAKSQLLRHIRDITPRGVYASGKSASAAGLTASAIKDEFGEGKWTLEAGALVLADQGVACIDELDKMSEQDRSSMHEAMEQQTVSINKAGMNATLRARCAILGAANPKLGRFNDGADIAEQINLPPTLLSRFDLIFPERDIPDVTHDTAVSGHILAVHTAGQQMRNATAQGRKCKAILLEGVQPVIATDLLKKFVNRARSVMPILSPEASAIIQQYYLNVRGGSKKSVPITARQAEALVRLSEASARVRLSDSITAEDAKRAVLIFQDYMNKVIGIGGGQYDIDSIATGMPRSQVDIMQRLITIISDLQRDQPPKQSCGVPLADIKARAKEAGIDETKVESVLNRGRHEMGIYAPRDGQWRAFT